MVRTLEVHSRRLDGTVRAGHATAQPIQLGGRPRLLTTIVEVS